MTVMFGPVVVADAAVCAWLRPMVVEIESAARRDGRPIPEPIARYLAELASVGAMYEQARMNRSAPVSDDGPISAPSSDMPPTSTPMTSSAVAERLHCTTRHVTRFIDAGHLRATRVGRSWLIDEASVVAFERARRDAA